MAISPICKKCMLNRCEPNARYCFWCGEKEDEPIRKAKKLEANLGKDLCIDCKENPPREHGRCSPCHEIYCVSRWNLSKRKGNLAHTSIVCRNCGNTFIGHPSRRYCYNPCKKLGDKLNAQKWIDRKENTNRLDENQVAYGFFRKKYGISKRFTGCRG